MRRFFLKADGSFESAFKFSAITFIVEMIFSAYICFSVLTTTRVGSLTSSNNIEIIYPVAFFFFRVFLIHVSFGCLLRTFEVIFFVKHRKTQYFLWLTYGCLFIAIKYPQVYDEMPWVSLALKNLCFFDYPWIRWLPAFALMAIYLLSFLKKSQKTPKQCITSVVSIILIICYFAYWQELDPETKVIKNPSIARSTKKPKIIFITVDSLRGDSKLELNIAASKSLRKYLSNSTRFKRVISPLPQTHAAISAIFSSLNPVTSGVRSNLSQEAIDTDALLANSPLSVFKHNGYRIKFMADTMEYANVSAGKIFDEVEAPDYAAANVVLSTFFKNRIVFGLFNNPMGRFFVPELARNSAFFFSYSLPEFTSRVLTELNRVAESDTPEILFIHTCSMHWPGILPYPYYPQQSFPEHAKVPFSYKEKHGTLIPNLTVDQWKIQARFNRSIYNSAVNMTVKKFLNPVMEQLEKSKLNENAIVVLLSDHGENLWDLGAKFPKRKFVEHGGSLIFGGSAELAYFRIGSPQLKKRNYDKNIGTIDIIPTILKLADLPGTPSEGQNILDEDLHQSSDDRGYYVETGIWPFRNFAGQYITTPLNGMAGVYQFSPVAKRIYVDSKFLPSILQQKQRAIYYKNFRYTIYPANSGLEEFLCNVESDRECITNLKTTENQTYQFLRKKMSEALQKDVNAGLLKVGACSKFSELSPPVLDLNQIKDFQWQYLFQGLECLHAFHDYGYVISIFDKLMEAPDSSILLKKYIMSYSLLLCAYTNIFENDNLPEFLKSYISDKNLNEMPHRHRSNAMKCLRALGRNEEANKLNDILTAEKEPPNKDSTPKPQVKTKLSEVMGISQKYATSPLEAYKKIDEYFKVERSYNFIDEMAGLRFEGLKAFLEGSSEESLFMTMKILVDSSSLDIGFFNFVLRRVDALEVPNFETNQLLNLRKSSLVKNSFTRPVEDIQKKEVLLATKKIAAWLCSKGSQYCLPARKILGDLSARTKFSN